MPRRGETSGPAPRRPSSERWPWLPRPRRRAACRWRPRPRRRAPGTARRSAIPSASRSRRSSACCTRRRPLLRSEPGVNLTTASFDARRLDTLFASTEGALCEQRITECGGGIAAVAVMGDESQVRSYPASHGGHVAQAGYEHLLALDLAGNAPRVSEEAVALLKAPACPSRRTAADPGRRAAGPPAARIGGARRGARPGAGPRGLVRRHQLRARRRDRDPAARLRAGEHPGRRHRRGRARHAIAGTTRASRVARSRSSTRGSWPASCPRARRPPRWGSVAPGAACGPTASAASRSCA